MYFPPIRHTIDYGRFEYGFNGITFGIISGMISTCNAGSQPLSAQAMMVGLGFANGLTPSSDLCGWKYGMAAAILHYYMVTTVPNLHGGFCLYNGGFTAALVCILLILPLEHHFMTKLERKALK